MYPNSIHNFISMNWNICEILNAEFVSTYSSDLEYRFQNAQLTNVYHPNRYDLNTAFQLKTQWCLSSQVWKKQQHNIEMQAKLHQKMSLPSFTSFFTADLVALHQDQGNWCKSLVPTLYKHGSVKAQHWKVCHARPQDTDINHSIDVCYSYGSNKKANA